MTDATDGNLPDDIEQLKAAIQLFADDEAYFIHRGPDGKIFPGLMLNDTFSYACADGEDIDWSQVVALRDRIRAGGWPEGIRWAQEEGRDHFNLKPIPEIQHSMNDHDRKAERIRELEKLLFGCIWYLEHAATPEDLGKFVDKVRRAI